jgi:hypothetical protein
MLSFPGEKSFNHYVDCGESDDDGNKWTRETFFSQFIPNTIINTRKILLGSLQEGLTFVAFDDLPSEIEKGCGLAAHWSMIPLQAIQQTYFARPEISVEDLFANIIQPKFGLGGECQHDLYVEFA